MTLRDRIRQLRARRNMRRGKCPECKADDVLLASGPGNTRLLCGPCWADTTPLLPADDARFDPRDMTPGVG
jgi:hypothetical protein